LRTKFGFNIYSKKSIIVCLLLIAWIISTLIVHAFIKSSNDAKIVTLAENGLSSSIASFSSFVNMGHIEDYYSGVASFNLYVEAVSYYESKNAYQRLAAYNEGKEILGFLINTPELAKVYMQDILDTLNAVCDDVTGADVHLRLAALKNILIEKGDIYDDYS